MLIFNSINDYDDILWFQPEKINKFEVSLNKLFIQMTD